MEAEPAGAGLPGRTARLLPERAVELPVEAAVAALEEDCGIAAGIEKPSSSPGAIVQIRLSAFSPPSGRRTTSFEIDSSPLYRSSVAAHEELPGEDLVTKGVADLEAGLESVEALLVSIGASRLAALGLDIPRPISSPEHRLYELLLREHPDSAHSRYNALVRRLVSFERALECVG